MTTTHRAVLDCLPHPPKFEYDWVGLGRLSELDIWFQRMAATPQHPAWHGEGDVWEHTQRVCEALAGMKDFRAMEARSRDALALAALLHDIGKVTTTWLEDGVWTSPRHGPVGAKQVRKLLWQDFRLCGDVDAQRFREAVCLLIRYHTKPPHLIDSDVPVSSIAWSSSSATTVALRGHASMMAISPKYWPGFISVSFFWSA